MIYRWGGNEKAHVNDEISFRLLSNMSHDLWLLRQIEDSYSMFVEKLCKIDGSPFTHSFPENLIRNHMEIFSIFFWWMLNAII